MSDGSGEHSGEIVPPHSPADWGAADHDLVAHLYAAALALMNQHRQAFLPLNTVQETLGWDDDLLGSVVDHCVDQSPVITLPGAPTGLAADWMDDGDRPAYGRSAVRFIGIRPI